MRIKLLLIVLVCMFYIGCGGEDKSNSQASDTQYMSNLPVKIPTKIPFEYRTSNGIQVFSVVDISQDKQKEVFSAIEEGINKQLIATKRLKPEWNKARNLVDYTVIFINPDTFNVETEPGSPALLFNGNIQTAGTVLGFGDYSYSGSRFNPPSIILPHQADSNWKYLNYLLDASRFESEHFAEGANDLSVWRYYATISDQHPHWKLEGE